MVITGKLLWKAQPGTSITTLYTVTGNGPDGNPKRYATVGFILVRNVAASPLAFKLYAGGTTAADEFAGETLDPGGGWHELKAPIEILAAGYIAAWAEAATSINCFGWGIEVT